MLRKVAIKDLRPNPFRRLGEYPILRHKVDQIKHSVEAVGFWESIIGRRCQDGGVEIAFGHHRLAALDEMYAPDHEVTIIIKDLSNDDMLRMMAMENLEEWAWTGWVEVETVRATIDAFAKGLIALPHVPKNTPGVREVRQDAVLLPYTKASVACFLGWTRMNNEGSTRRPDHRTEVAFMAIDALDQGLVRESDLIGLHRGQIEELIRGMRHIKATHEKEAEQQRAHAEDARRRAVEATSPAEKRRQEQRADTFTAQMNSSTTAASAKPRQFRERAVEGFRQSDDKLSAKGARALASSMIDAPSAREKIKRVDDIGARICKRLNAFLEEDELAEDVRFIKRHRNDLKDSVAARVRQCAESLRRRLGARIIDGLSDTARDGGRQPAAAGRQGLNGPGHVGLLPHFAAESGEE